MIVEYIRYETERGDGLIAAYEEARRSLDASPHCLGYELSRCSEDAKCFVLRIEWDSAEGHMQGFRSSPEFRALLAAVRPFLPDIREMRHYERTNVSA
jgi:quinol monooxygenase YgiN